MGGYILAIDQGTTSTRSMVFDRDMRVIGVGQREFPQHFPASGWVEHDAEDIWKSVLETIRLALADAGIAASDIEAIGITNQRETTVLWDRNTGEAVHRAVVWQDRRAAPVCEDLKRRGLEPLFSKKTGLLLDPYFSGTKLKWLLDSVSGLREKAVKGEICFGTVDSFLIYRLTGGRRHVTDATNASRTLIYNIEDNAWDDELLSILDIPRAMLPEVLDCAADFGMTEKSLFGAEIPILGVAGDQQAATIGQGCFAPAETKSTYGTGAFVLTNMGENVPRSSHRLLGTVLMQHGGKRTYALEGSVFVAGSLVQWLRDSLGLITSAAETEALARSVANSGGVTIVPALSGLGAPHWNAEARGVIAGLSFASGRAEIARAALEAMAHQTHDLARAFAADGAPWKALRIDGGMSANDWMAQDLADMLELPVERPDMVETTALGAGILAGVGAGLFGSLEEAAQAMRGAVRHFTSAMDEDVRAERLARWARALAAV